MNTIPLVESVTPSENDMMLPLSVMKVMPTATQPMNDVVFSSENRLTAVKKPGVVTATPTSASTASKRIATRTCPRRRMWQRQPPIHVPDAGSGVFVHCLLGHDAASVGWVMSATMRCIETSLRR